MCFRSSDLQNTITRFLWFLRVESWHLRPCLRCFQSSAYMPHGCAATNRATKHRWRASDKLFLCSAFSPLYQTFFLFLLKRRMVPIMSSKKHKNLHYGQCWPSKKKYEILMSFGSSDTQTYALLNHGFSSQDLVFMLPCRLSC